MKTLTASVLCIAAVLSLSGKPTRSDVGGRSEGEPRLPYESEVEYVEFTGINALDTLIPMADIRKIDIYVDWTAHSTRYREYMGGGTSGSYIIEVSPAGYFGVGVNAYSPYSPYGIDRLEWYCEGNGHPELWVNGEYGCTDPLARTPVSTFKIGGVGYLNYNWPHCKVYGLEIQTDGEEVVRDMMPVRVRNRTGVSMGAFYDKTSGEIFLDANGRPFGFGPDKEW